MPQFRSRTSSYYLFTLLLGASVLSTSCGKLWGSVSSLCIPINAAFDSTWTPEQPSLMGVWHLDEAVGPTLSDSTVNGHSMTIAGTLDLGVPGEIATAGIFNGVTSTYATASSVFAFANTTFSVSFWYNSTVGGVLISNGADAALNAGWGVWLSSGSLCLTLKNTSLNIISFTTTSTNFADGNWHHAVMIATTDTVTYTNNVISIYVDGSNSQGSMLYQGAFPYQSPGASRSLGFGARGMNNGTGSANFYSGSLDEVAIWNTALSPSEIQEIYLRQSYKYTGCPAH